MKTKIGSKYLGGKTVFTSVRYVIRENTQNMYRIFSIAKYELLADMRDSKLGWFWNFANPAIQVMTYWFVFGYVFNRKSVGHIPYGFLLVRVLQMVVMLCLRKQMLLQR